MKWRGRGNTHYGFSVKGTPKVLHTPLMTVGSQSQGGRQKRVGHRIEFGGMGKGAGPKGGALRGVCSRWRAPDVCSREWRGAPYLTTAPFTSPPQLGPHHADSMNRLRLTRQRYIANLRRQRQ
jgi:hypothetical protein